MSKRSETFLRGRELLAIVASVRRRWRLRRALQGLAIVLGAGWLVFFAATFGIDRLRFDPGAVTAARFALWASVLGFAAWFLVRPLFRRVSDEQVALYLEEHEPSLRSAFLAAVQAAEHDPDPDGLDGRLLDVAVARAREVEQGRRVEQDGLKRSSAWLAGVGSIVLLAALLGPGFQQTAGSLLFRLGQTADAANPYAIDVEPGDILIARGSDQRVIAVPRGFETDNVEIAVKRGDSETWDRYAMSADDTTTGFEILLFDLDEPTEYTIESEGVRSDVYRIDVADLPYVDRIDLTYRFPAYTGLDPRVVEDGGDIAAIRGTEVALRITPTIPTAGARIVFDDEAPAGDETRVAEDSAGTRLTATDDGFEATILVDRETFYRIELEGPDGRYVVASPDFLVETLEDQPPAVKITDPGRDRSASPIEEVFIEVEAEDDFGITSMRLHYTVNGGEEQTVNLHGTRRGGVTELRRGHTLFLEEFGLQPGDVISYHASAADLGGTNTRREMSDIYFVEIRPFDRDFRQAEQGGGGGGGGGLEGDLSKQQRQIVAATFRLVRDPDEFDAGERAENVTMLTLMQGRLRQQVAELIAEMQQRGVAANPEFATVFEELPKAAEAMEEAERNLGEGRVDDALSPEQKALQHLLRAEAAFRDVQIQMSQNQPGGGGQAPETDELADLFEMEMDKLRNQYESVQRGEQQQVDEQVDAALQKLEELARRQQQMNERSAAQPRGAQGGDGQDQLIEQTEELARQLERLARQDDRQELRDAANQLRQSANQMRRAQAGQRGGQNQAEANRALERLQNARRLLENRQTAGLERDVNDARQRAERMLDRQRDLEEDTRQAAQAGSGERIEEIRERKDELAGEVDALQEDLARLARESRREQPEASRSLDAAADSIVQDRIRDRILFAKGMFGQASPEAIGEFEQQITNMMEETRDRIADAQSAFGESDPRRLQRQLDDARNLVRGLESLQERVRQQQEGEAGDQQGGEPGEQQGEQEQEGQQGEGGEQPGQQGQQPGQGQPGGRQVPGAAGGGAGFGGSAGGAGGAPALTEEQIRQLQREFARRRDEATGLAGELQREGVDTGDLAEAIQGLDRLAAGGVLDDPEEVERLQEQVLRGLKDFEFTLRRGLTPELEKLFLSGSDDVPAEYRELVEAYYRSLSEGQ